MENRVFKASCLILLGFCALAGVAEARGSSGGVSVKGYTKADGTYVAPYHRTAPDSTINNNYSTQPNSNPYTGKDGTKAPNPYQPYGGAP